MLELRNYGITERQKDRQGKSSIAPTFSKRGYNNLILIKTLAEVVTSNIICTLSAQLRPCGFMMLSKNQRTNGPVNAHLISWPRKAQNIQNLENIW